MNKCDVSSIGSVRLVAESTTFKSMRQYVKGVQVWKAVHSPHHVSQLLGYVKLYDPVKHFVFETKTCDISFYLSNLSIDVLTTALGWHIQNNH